jgi:DNA segregation ATPase FtsK/SpoIIIE, S-DNA-T family
MIGGAMRAVLVGKPRIRRWVYGAVAVPLSASAFAAWPVPETWPLSAGLGGMFGDGVFNLAVLPFRA